MDAGLYRRVLLKLSGESFARQGERGISMEEVLHIARQTVQAAGPKVKTGISDTIRVKGRLEPVEVFEVVDVE